jgi:hypothetical protein
MQDTIRFPLRLSPFHDGLLDLLSPCPEVQVLLVAVCAEGEYMYDRDEAHT